MAEKRVFNLFSKLTVEKVKDFPDDIERWPVKMLIEVEVKELKELFSTLAKKIMDKIKK